MSALRSSSRLVGDATGIAVTSALHRDGAHSFYGRLAWTAVGGIPDYALDPDGVTPHATVFFCKNLAD